MIIITQAETQTFNIIPRDGVVEYTTQEDGTITLDASVLTVKFVEEETNNGASFLNLVSNKYPNYLALQVTATVNTFRKNFNYFMEIKNNTTGKLFYRDRLLVLDDNDVPYNNTAIHSIDAGEYEPFIGISSDNEYIILND